MISKIYNSKGFQSALPWIVLLIGMISFLYGKFGNIENQQVSAVFSDIGKVFLTGGIFGVLLKSMQFMGIFKEEIIKVIYEPKFLENRNDLPELWEKMSTVLFQNKFPNVSEKLLKDVRETYFPTKEITYYENSEHQIELRVIDKANKIIKITETATLDVVCENSKITTSYLFGHSTDDISKFKLLKFTIDGSKPKNSVTKTEEMYGEKFEVTTTELKGKERYAVEKASERTIDLKIDNIIGFDSKKILHKLKIQFHHDEDVEVELMKSGILGNFTLKKENATFKEYQFDGIVYPEQGYNVAIKLK
ncbi:hypothetical protein [Flavobacterium sp. N2820]|uniref:hypothetical protein n=1 Tax=Flavobacterium sp. N2820 TaxID=2986834 RepID=UPI002225A218|nr:hypothetical protein [Flavobacterium sp. N2820]